MSPCEVDKANISALKTHAGKFIFFAIKYRTRFTRIFSIFLILVLVFTKFTWLNAPFIELALESIGIIFIGVCVAGRLWASMYIAGNKARTLVRSGPYSIVRHPLYLSSFVGAVGLGLFTRNLIIMVSLPIVFVLHYALVIVGEEKEMVELHGPSYLRYIKEVPRIIPDFKIYKDADCLEVQTKIYSKSLMDTIWFIWGTVLIDTVIKLQDSFILPILFAFTY